MAFSIMSDVRGPIVLISVTGELDANVAGQFRDAVAQSANEQTRRLVLDLTDLEYMASAGLRVLVFARQKMPADVDIFVIGAHDAVYETIEMTGFHRSVNLLDAYDAAIIETF